MDSSLKTHHRTSVIARVVSANLDESFLQLCTSEQQRKCLMNWEPESGFENDNVTVSSSDANVRNEIQQKNCFMVNHGTFFLEKKL